eukprot:scaffold101708_cov36-Phaeocystis_antarctica.AAC.2
MSGRLASACPSLTKVGPSSSTAGATRGCVVPRLTLSTASPARQLRQVPTNCASLGAAVSRITTGSTTPSDTTLRRDRGAHLRTDTRR